MQNLSSRALSSYDAIVVGSGPNGLAAAITLAQAGRSVLVVEGHKSLGGGCRSAELTVPGFVHDFCSAVHPLAIASPFFRTLPLEKFGLEWIHPTIPLAHPLDEGKAVFLYRSLEETCANLKSDAKAYQRLMEPMVSDWPEFFDDLLRPLQFPRRSFRLFQMLRFGWWALHSAVGLTRGWFREPEASALFGGLAAHSFLRLTQSPSAAIGLVLGVAGHRDGWPIPKGGAQKLIDALVSYLISLGGQIQTNCFVQDVRDLPRSKALFFDVSPRQLIQITKDLLPSGYRHRLSRFRQGPGVFKVDWALSGPIPWENPKCLEAGTVHLGGKMEELVLSEQAHWNQEHCKRPFILLSQPSVFDDTRAPAGKHTVWAYCHVPRGSTEDMTQFIEEQIERFAPGFKKQILAKKTTSPHDFELYNPNLEGGDISGGISDLGQVFFRPTFSWNPYVLPQVNGVKSYICSASAPPGAGVHGMCGYHSASVALQRGI